ncbi:DsbA family protein [Candidatus Dojkabacteria bacterium]|uniref:DsbA family protein n=1 Tax=Candidatus Dojkabacteria bacterium TaxID=2099670 RepID=A0A955L3A5_9BACT|nr:DsbA family protein [Candidatus Dojkabacteria bacterium]
MDKTNDSNSGDSIDIAVFMTPLSIILASIIIASSIFFGLKGTDLSTSSGSNTKAADTAQPTAGDTAAAPTTTAVVSIDDDPYLGNKDKAKVAVVEFSDYECPFCKRFHDDTFDQIVTDYVDTGKAILVYRDYPLSFHDPMATNEAIAGECIQDQAGNEKYFQYGDLMYTNTTSNGTGLKEQQLYDFAKQVGADEAKFKDCYTSRKFEEEVKADEDAGAKAGISGTPGFVVGTLDSDGNVDGVIVSGAQPYSAFQTALENALAK